MTEDAYSLYWNPEDFADPWCDDMSKAPRDGTCILAAWSHSGSCAVVRWSEEECSWLEGASDYVSDCTHWMPLPKLPRAK